MNSGGSLGFARDKLLKDFSKAASCYAARATLQARMGEALIKAAALLLTPEALLVDVGAGTGDVTCGWPCRAVALDVAFGMCREAAKKQPAVQAAAECLPLKDASVDAVASNAMLQWITQPERFFAESFRVLKPGGLLAVTSFTQGTLSELARAFALAGEEKRLSDFTSPERLTQKIIDAGFEIISVRNYCIREYYDDLLDLCMYLREIGATNKRRDRPRGMLTLGKLREVASHYPREERGLPASWQVHQVMARKI